MKNSISCFRYGDKNICPHCEAKQIVKNGKTTLGTQRYKCKHCNKRFIIEYKYNAYCKNTNSLIIVLIKEGMGIRSIARVLAISTTTLLKRIIYIANKIKKPPIPIGKIYEVDEMRTFVGKKTRLFWIVYALERSKKQVVDFTIGNRTNKTLQRVISSLELSQAKKIYTDKLRNYMYLISPQCHSTNLHATNHIERNNLTLRTHLKCLNRRTICFSRNHLVLYAVLKIYFWS